MLEAKHENIVQNPGLKGFLGFDNLAQYHKSLAGFRQTPDYLVAVEYIQNLDHGGVELFSNAEELGQPLIELGLKAQDHLSQAQVSYRLAMDAYNGRNIRSFLYRVSSFFSIGLAERIIPYFKTKFDLEDAWDELHGIEAEREAIISDAALKNLGLKLKKTFAQSRLKELEQKWLSDLPGELLPFAMSDFAKQIKSDNGTGKQDSPPPTNELFDEDGDLEDEKEVLNYYYEPGICSEKDKDNKTVINRKVLLDISGNPLVLEELSEVDLESLVARSGTPISLGQLQVIIGDLSASFNPLGEYQRYPHTVHLGEYKGFHVLKKGKKGRVLFKYFEDKLHIRFGDYYSVYADGKKWSG